MGTGVSTIAETRDLEREVIEAWGVPVHVLMERAAIGVASIVAGLRPTSVAVLAGAGHNGGDAIACARVLSGWGIGCSVYFAGRSGSGVVKEQLEWAACFGVPVHGLGDFRGADVVVDGLFGFGLSREPAGDVAEVIRYLNGLGPRAVVSIDLPSGTLGDTGVAPGERVLATHTVATGLVKVGVVSDPAVEAVGELWWADIGLPLALTGQLAGGIVALDVGGARSASGHKGTFGTALVIGGSVTMSGAPALAALAAGRSGAGLVVVGVPAPIRDVVAGLVPEALVVPLSCADSGFLSWAAFDELAPWLARADSVAIGPGLGQGEGPLALVKRVWADWDGPLVLDADALMPEVFEGAPRARGAIITPHPGEAGRILGCSAAEVQNDRLGAGRALASRFGVVCVLKGARTLVVRPDGGYGVLVRTTPALATAGSGDVLTGLIGGFLAQGDDLRRATERGVGRHAAIGLCAARQADGGGLLARDLINYRGDLHQSLLECPVPSQAIRLA